jgi:hypothetical protein
MAWAIEFCGFLKPPAERQEATARCANRRLPVSFKALIRRDSLIGGHARQQCDSLGSLGEWGEKNRAIFRATLGEV